MLKFVYEKLQHATSTCTSQSRTVLLYFKFIMQLIELLYSVYTGIGIYQKHNDVNIQ
jgi:hypothetical protein